MRGVMQRSINRSGATLLLLALAACAKAGALPLPVLGPDQSVATGSVVTLNGAASHDPQGASITFQWSFVSVRNPDGSWSPGLPAGSRASFRLADTPNPLFTADATGKYVVQLVVHTKDYASDPAVTTITATDC